MKKVSFNSRGRKVTLEAKILGPLGKISGLMFKTKNTDALMFEFRKPTKMGIHSFFVFFPFIAVWLNSKNSIIEIKKVDPFAVAVSPKKAFSKLIEIPISEKYRKQIKLLSNDVI